MSVDPFLWLSISSMESVLTLFSVSTVGTLPLLLWGTFLSHPSHAFPLQHGPPGPSKGSDVRRGKFTRRKLTTDATEQGSSPSSITYKLKFP